MAIATYIRDKMADPEASVIRRMFEEGLELKRKYGESKVYDFSLGNPDTEPPLGIIQAMREVLEENIPHSHGYMPNAGYDFTRKAMADKTTIEQGVAIDGEYIVMSSGAAGALNAVLKAIVNPGDKVVVPCPYFAEYRHYIANHGGLIREVAALDDFSLNIDGVERALDKDTVALILNSPNNPSGRVYTKDEIHSLCRVLARHNARSTRCVYLICDEPYRDLVYDGATVTPVFTEYAHSIIVTSFAKNLSLAGERIGYIAVNPLADCAKELVAACIFSTRILGFVNANAFFQRVVAKAWNCKIDLSSYIERRKCIMAVMDSAGIEYVKPEGAFYLFCRAPAPYSLDDALFCKHLKEYNILCAPGRGFGKRGYFRLSYCVSLDTIENSKDYFVQAMQNRK